MDMGSFEIDHACCVDEAFKKLTVGNYDVVVSDYEMPQKNGLDFLKELRETKNDIPFILFTGKGREEVAIKALNLGADGYFNKLGRPETVYGELSHGIQQVIGRKISEEALKQSELRWATTLANIGDAVIATDTSGKVTFMNLEAEKLTGWNPREALQKPVNQVYNIINEQTRMGVADLVELVLEKKLIIRLGASSVLVRRDGSEVAVDENAAPLKDNEGNLAGVVLVFRDITQRRKVAQELLCSEANYQGLFDSTLDGIIVCDDKGSVVSANPAAAAMLGYKNGVELVNLPSSTFYANPGDMQVLLGVLAKKGAIQDFEAKFMRKNGEVFDALTTVNIQNDLQGNLLRVESIFRDVTERKIADLVIFEAREYAQNIMATMRESLLVLDDNLKVVSANDSFYRTFEVTAKETEGNCIFDLGDCQWDIPKLRELLEKIIPKHSFFAGFEVEHVFPRIGHRTMLLNAKQMLQRVKGANLILVAFEDITEHKKAEEAAKTDAVLRNTLLDNVPCIALILEKKTHIIVASNKIAQELGALPGKTCFETCAGESVPCNFCLAPNLWDTNEKQILEEVKHKDRIYRDIWLPYSQNLYVHYIFDITETKKAKEELNRTIDQLVLVNEKLRVVGSLTRHDVKNKLSAVSGYAYLLKEKYADQAGIVDGLVKMEHAVADSVKIFEFAKIYEQLGVEELSFVNVETAFNDALALFSSLTFKVVNDCQGLVVLADSFLKQLFYNFVDNTRRYGKKVATVRVYFDKTESGGGRLIYEDDGVGISAENKLKLFSKGFSTGGSTGFGLFLTKKMIDVYGWSITEEGEPGVGARFVLTIPKLNKNGKDNFQIT